MQSAKRRATYQDVLDAPENQVAELMGGELYLHPRPAPRHARAQSRLQTLVDTGFDLGSGGPGAWLILTEPELRLGSDMLVPEIAGWRRSRMPELPNEAFTLAPDWVCEVLAPATAITDRWRKLPIYAEAGVPHAWLVDPLAHTIEALALLDGRWQLLSAHLDAEKARIPPFEAVELDLGLLWAN